MKKYPVECVCAWCGLDMGFADFMADSPGCATHGICKECDKKVRKEFECVERSAEK